MSVRRPCAAGRGYYCGDRPGGKYDSIRAACAEIVHDFFHGNDGALRGQYHFLLDSDDALDENVACAVGFLRVDNADVGSMGRYRGQALTGERAIHEPDVR